MAIRIKTSPKEVLPYISQVIALADSDRDALGFIPNTAYEVSALQGKLIIAVNNEDQLCGHLLHGGVFPHGRIFQLVVAEGYRGKGIASSLVEELRNKLSAAGWIGITAKVAQDLTANEAWERLGFRTVRTVKGGATRGRILNLRACDLETPNLFALMSPKRVSEIRLFERFSNRAPIYLIDLNVFFDVVRDRPRSEVAGKVIEAGFTNRVRLMVTEEFKVELERTSKNYEQDPALSFARQLTRLRLPPKVNIAPLIADLARLIFPERFAQGKNHARDISDLIHIATAIHHRVGGFITSEKAILKQYETLRDKYGLEVTGVEEFVEFGALASEPRAFGEVEFSAAKIVIRNVTESEVSLPPLLSRLGVSGLLIEELHQIALSKDGDVTLAEADGEIVGAMFREVLGGLSRSINLFIAIDESHASAEIVAEHFFNVAGSWVTGASLIKLTLLPHQNLLRKTALAAGYSYPQGQKSDGVRLMRFSLGEPLTESNWADVRHRLMSVGGISLPLKAPEIRDAGNTLKVELPGKEIVEISLLDLERILAPTIFLLPKRQGLIVPIRRQYSSVLLGNDAQFSWLSSPEAVLRKERVYICAAQGFSKWQVGAPILFYESLKDGGRGAIVAMARICDARITAKGDALAVAKKKGAVNSRSVEQLIKQENTAEISFDNIFKFKKLVGLRRLKELGVIDGSNLITARKVDFVHLMKLVEEGVLNA